MGCRCGLVTIAVFSVFIIFACCVTVDVNMDAPSKLKPKMPLELYCYTEATNATDRDAITDMTIVHSLGTSRNETDLFKFSIAEDTQELSRKTSVPAKDAKRWKFDTSTPDDLAKAPMEVYVRAVLTSTSCDDIGSYICKISARVESPTVISLEDTEEGKPRLTTIKKQTIKKVDCDMPKVTAAPAKSGDNETDSDISSAMMSGSPVAMVTYLATVAVVILLS